MSAPKKIPLLAVVGPTASGKTALGVELAAGFSGEVVSADSMQIYRGMPIAAAVPDMTERAGIPHHLIELLDRTSSFSVADYVNLAHQIICEIYSRNHLPVLVGGTGLYVNSLIDNIQFLPAETDLKLRERLFSQLEEQGAPAMLERLRSVDPQTAQRLHPNNARRIIRALEVYELTGHSFSRQNELSRTEPSPYEPFIIGITFADRQLLYSRIRDRVDKMLERGLLDEARSTLDTSGGGAVQAIGHKELHRYLKGELSLDEAVELLKRETCRFAKRQLTWFKRDERIHWIEADCVGNVAETAKQLVKEADFFERLTQSN